MRDCRLPLTVLAPTSLEYWAARCVVRRVPVRRAGMALERRYPIPAGSAVIVCGLAGALRPDLLPGTVLVPETIGRPDGTTLRCDPGLRALLLEGAHALSYPVESGPLLTAPSLVTGDGRQEWAGRGFVAADMETGLLAGGGIRVATVRVVLDTPHASISAEWERPLQALSRPALWSELLWLARAAPRYSLRAARVVDAALRVAPLAADLQEL